MKLSKILQLIGKAALMAVLALPAANAHDCPDSAETSAETHEEAVESHESRHAEGGARYDADDGDYKGTVGIYCLDRKGRFTMISPEDLNDRHFDECVDDFFDGLDDGESSDEPGAEPSGRTAAEAERRERFRKAYEEFVRAIRTLN